MYSHHDHPAHGRVAAVARKEIRDSFRDRRAILVMLVTAIVAGPVLLMLVMNLIAKQLDRGRELSLPVVGSEQAPALMAFLERQQISVVPAPSGFEDQIRTGDLDVVLEVDTAFAQDVAAGKRGKVRLYYDRSRDRARPSIDQVESVLRAYNAGWGQSRLILRGVAPAVSVPLDIEARDLATPQSSGALVLFLVAYYGLFAAVMGGMAAALDTTAGERERGSLEPLLTTPVSPLEIAVGKWLAICLLNLLVVAVTLAGFYLTLRFGPLPAVGIPFVFGLAQFGAFVLVLVPLIVLVPAFLLYVGMRGRSVKEAQANISVLLFAVSILPAAQMFLQKKEPDWLHWLPVTGQYSLLSRVLRGDPLSLASLAASYALPALLTAVALMLTARILSRESVLAGK
jgi:sodium transport system permease protein